MSMKSLSLPAGLGWLICGAGAAGIFATYWDESWHTDIGRDSFWTPAHLLLYGAMAVVGVSIAVWGLRVLLTLKSARRALAQLPVVAACLGGVAALAAAPIDNAWHEAFGRDAVEWSPPHMLVVFAATAIALGALAGIDPNARALRAAAGTLLLANAAAVVFEYETDVPQFTEVIYLPILLAVGLTAAGVLRRAVPLAAPVLTACLGYAVLRLAIGAILALLGRSTPDLPIAVLGLAAYDLPLRGRYGRPAAAAAATAALAWAASALGLASESTSAVGVVAAPVLVVAALILAASYRPARVAWPAALIVLAAAFSYLNHVLLRLPTAIGATALALGASLALVLVGHAPHVVVDGLGGPLGPGALVGASHARRARPDGVGPRSARRFAGRLEAVRRGLEWRRLHFLDLDADGLQKIRHVWNLEQHADRTHQRGLLRNDLVRRQRGDVSSRCGETFHHHDHRLLGLETRE